MISRRGFFGRMAAALAVSRVPMPVESPVPVPPAAPMHDDAYWRSVLGSSSAYPWTFSFSTFPVVSMYSSTLTVPMRKDHDAD